MHTADERPFHSTFSTSLLAMLSHMLTDIFQFDLRVFENWWKLGEVLDQMVGNADIAFDKTKDLFI